MTASTLYMEGLAIARELGLKELIASCLEGLAGVATLQSKCAWAATLWGTAETLREAVHIPIPLIDRANYERSVASTRTRLGESAFATLWAQGRTMTPEQVLALREQEIALSPPPATTTSSVTYPAGLTAREVQVLRLVARGLTNTEIGEELGLSEKTIAHHLTHIFNKTTTENRAAAVAFAFRHDLA
jgi:DNA-binding CsgD family transcriptional regulator